VIGPVLIAAGGTGGHMFPALALAHELRGRGRAVALLTDLRGARFVDGNLPLHLITAGSPSGPLRQRLAGLARLAIGLAQCVALFLRLRPCAAACFGGYAAVPPALAAAAGRRPLLVHEQNAVLGKANRLVARFAAVLALSYEHTERILPAWRHRLRVTGNPVRLGFAADGRRYAAPARGEAFRLLVLGGSQGARVFADVVPGAVALLPESLRRRLVIHQQCRPEDLERTRAAYAALGTTPALEAFFADVPQRMAEAHLVICRAGASTVAELLACGRPSLLVPYAHAADDHQRANAAELQRAGAADMVLERSFTAGSLSERLRALMEEPSRLATMAQRAHAIARPDAARRLADLVLDTVQCGGRS
jgi:UDP-N-acetylglucosamine--N-acetylmuramyl-(pentapeptide) pyrophosphoryl-undecaprenol N-acetylglucosamine transferase